MALQRIVVAEVSPQSVNPSWESDTILRIGRLETLEIFIDDPSISRRHCEILATDQGWMIHDLGSTNGTYLNSIRLGRTDRMLHREDVIKCGNRFFVVNELQGAIAPQKRRAKPKGRVLVESTARRPWDRAVVALSRPSRGTTEQSLRLLRRLQSGYHLCHANSLAELLLSVLEDSVTTLDAQGGTILLAAQVANQLDLARSVSVPMPNLKTTHRLRRSVMQRAFTRGESMLCRAGESEIDGEAKAVAPSPGGSIVCALVRSPRRRLGVLCLERSQWQDSFTKKDLLMADAIAASVSVGIETAMQTERQRELFLQTVTALAQAVEMRDCYTGGHTQRVTAYALLLADELRLSPDDRHTLQIGVPLHDIGKIGIHDTVLGKTSGLTPTEQEYMRSHVAKGVAILETIPELAKAIPIVRSHHERWDGGGYPDGLSGDKIPLTARVVAVADAFDAMTSDRPYRRGMSLDEGIRALQAGAGEQFDPHIVAAFVGIRPKVERLLAEEAEFKRLAESTPGTSPSRPSFRDMSEAASHD